jgi:hypothetical protein
MRCEDVRRLISDRLDEPLVPAREAEVEDHLEGCAECRSFDVDVHRLRGLLAVAPAPMPDVTDRVLASLHRESAAGGARPGSAAPVRRRGWVPVAAAFAGAALVGALLVGGADRDGTDVASADLVERLDEAQTSIRALSAELSIVEHGLHPEVPDRRFTGTLEYRAPETMALHLEDVTDYPVDAWPRNDVDLVVDDDTWWTAGIRDCPAVDQPGCLSSQPEVDEVTEREPFSPSAPAPLDLVTPVQSFRMSGTPATLAPEEVDGRSTLGLEVTAAQVAPLLEGLTPAGNLRQVHPTDPVELRLDEASLVPVAATVRAGAGELRAQWALAHGYVDVAGAPVLEVRLADLRLDGDARAPEVLAPPAGVERTTRSEGFGHDGSPPADPPPPDALPGFRLHRTGATPRGDDGELIVVSAWTDGRAWLTQRSVAGRTADRLFGELGASVRPVDLGTGGVAYLSEDGRSAAVHGMAGPGLSIDVVVTGSVDPQVLLAHLRDIGVVGLPVPDDWAEAAAATLEEVAAALPSLVLPPDLEGFAAPAFRIEGPSGGPVVRAAYAGPGDRFFVLVQSAGEQLTPPLDTADVVAVEVRGVAGRYSPERGLLEWVDDATVRSLRSTSLGLAELVVIAESMEPSP